MPYSCQAVSAIAAYRALLRIVGPAYILVAFLGRIPLAMNGGQLLALAIGGCLANDVRFIAAVRNDKIDDVQVDVSLDIDDDGVVTSADVVIRLVVPDGVDTSAIVRETVEISTVLNAVRNGFPVTVR